MIARLVERAARRAARRMLMAGRGWALRCTRRPRPRGGGIESVRTVVAIRLDGLGDLVLTLPGIDDLAAVHADARKVVLVRPGLAPLLHGRASVDEVIPVPEGGEKVTLDLVLGRLEADLGVDFSPPDDTRVARAMARAGIPVRVGLVGGGREVFLTRSAVVDPCTSLPEINARLVEAAGGAPTKGRPVHVVPTRESREAEFLLRRLGAPGRPRIAVHPGGRYPTQRWPLERFAAAARRLAARWSARVVILGGPADGESIRTLQWEVAEHAVVVSPQCPRELAAVLGRCDLLLANNSGPLHLAGAVGVPTVSTMGPTDPARFWPAGRTQVVLRRGALACSPCTRGRCSPHDCLRGIGVDEFVEAADGLLDRLAAEARNASTGVGA